MNRKKALLFLVLLLSFTIFSLPAQSDAASVKELYNLGAEAQGEEDYFRAIELYKMALQMSPSYLDPMRGLAESYFLLGEYREALKWCIEAVGYDKNNLVLKTLQARILIGLGQYDQAEELFNEVLLVEPYNFEAQFGLAELNIVRGRTLQAQMWYEKAMNLRPKNRRAILSLALVYEASEQIEKAEELVKLALHHYPSSYMVQYLAGRHYFNRNELDRAEIHAKKALALKKSFPEAMLLLGMIFLHQGNYGEVIETVGELLKTDQNNYLLWYTIGVAYENTNQISQCINAYSKVFRIRPDDEIARISLENVLLNRFDPDAPERLKYAEYHFSKGKTLQERNYYQKALEEYRRGLLIAPFSKEGRKLYAEIFKAFGYYEKYLSQLLILQSEGFEDNYISDEIEIYQSLLDDEVSDKWAVQQYPGPLGSPGSETENKLLDQRENRFTLQLFYDKDEVETNHPLSEPNITAYFYDFLKNERKVNLLDEVYEYTGFSDAFRLARSSGSHFFLVFSYRENERAFSGKCDLYNSATGGIIKTFRVFRTGNDKVKNSMERLSAYINEDMPIRGKIVDKEFDTALINLGRANGIRPEMEFVIVQTEEVIINPETLEPSYPDESILGTFTVTDVDELVAEGTITTSVFFDLINPGDTVLPIIPEEETEEDTAEDGEQEEQSSETERGPGNLDLYREILKIQ